MTPDMTSEERVIQTVVEMITSPRQFGNVSQCQIKEQNRHWSKKSGVYPDYHLDNPQSVDFENSPIVLVLDSGGANKNAAVLISTQLDCNQLLDEAKKLG